jgi:Protein of unknown function (DUF6044)
VPAGSDAGALDGTMWSRAAGAGGALARRRGTMAVLFIIWALWLACPYFAFGSHSYVRIHDNGDSTLALRVSLGATAGPAHLTSWWNPLPLAGLDQGPLINCGLDVDGWLFALLPGWLAYGLIMFAQRLIAGYFTWRFARDRLNLSFLASVCAGLVYAVFCQATINVDWAGPTLYDGLSLACLPLALWALDDSSGWSRRRRVLLAVLLGALLGLTSHYSGAVFIVIAVVIWLLVRRRSAGEAALVAGLFALTWVAAEAPAIWSSLVNAPLSNRAAWALRPLSLGAAFSREFAYVRGIVLDNRVMVAAGLLGLVAARFRDRRLWAAIGAALAVFAIILVYSFWLTGLRRYGGPLSAFQFDRFYLLAPFILIIAGVLGLDALRLRLERRLSPEAGGRGRLWAAAATLLVIAVLGPLASARVQVRIAREMAAGSTYAALYLRPEMQRLAADNANSPPFRVATVYAPQAFASAPDSYWSFLFGALPAFAWAYGLETVDGYVQMYPASYQRFWGRLAAPALARDKAMSDYFWHWGNRVYLFVPSEGKPLPPVTDLATICDPGLLSLANVRYLVSPVQLSGDGLVLVSGDGRGDPWPIYIYENTRVLPRFFLAGSTRALADQAAVLTAMASSSTQVLGSVAFVRSGDTARLAIPRSTASSAGVRVDSYRSDAIALSVPSGAGGMLVGTMNYGASWHAYVDGQPARMVRVDATFVGVPLAAGPPPRRTPLRAPVCLASAILRRCGRENTWRAQRARP